MNVRFAAVLIAIQASLVTAAWAAPTWISVEAGSSSPVGDFAHSTRTGFHGGLALSYLPASRAAGGAGIQLNYHHFGEGDPVGFPFFGISARPDVAEALLFARANLTNAREPVGPYFRAGIGVAQVSVNIELVTPAGTYTEHASARWATLLAGLGWSIPAGTKQRVELEACFRQIESNPNVSYVTAGVTLALGADR